jgi:REP element-mobilizing transposase RayT
MQHAFMLPDRKVLHHGIPSWVEDGADFFITICTQPRRLNQLCDPDIAKKIHAAFNFYQNRGDLWLHLLVLMPDHLHAIMSFNALPGMQKSISEFKKFTAKSIGIKWQRGFFDHRLRRDESYIEKAHYIRMNPVRAGLCGKPEDWCYVWGNPPCQG